MNKTQVLTCLLTTLLCSCGGGGGGGGQNDDPLHITVSIDRGGQSAIAIPFATYDDETTFSLTAGGDQIALFRNGDTLYIAPAAGLTGTIETALVMTDDGVDSDPRPLTLVITHQADDNPYLISGLDGLASLSNRHDNEFLWISADARYLMFPTKQNYWLPDDEAGGPDVVFIDHQTGFRYRPTAAHDGGRSDATVIFEDHTFMDRDGSIVVFTSNGTNHTIDSIDDSFKNQVYIWQRDSGLTSLVTVQTASFTGPHHTEALGLSRNGRYLLLRAWNTTDGTKFMLLDRNSGDTTEMTTLSAVPYRAAISDDGQYLGLITSDSLVAADTNGFRDCYRVHTGTLAADLVNIAHDGNDADAYTYLMSMDAAGTRFAFISGATNILATDTNGAADCFIRDFRGPSPTTTRVSVALNGDEVGGVQYKCGIDDSGSYVVYANGYNDLGAGGTYRGKTLLRNIDDLSDITAIQNYLWHINPIVFSTDHFLVERNYTDISMFTTSDKSYQDIDPDPLFSGADVSSWVYRMSSDGDVVTYTCSGTREDYANNGIIRHQRSTGQNTWVSVDQDGDLQGGTYPAFGMSADGRFIVFCSGASLLPEDTDSVDDVYLYDHQDGSMVLLTGMSDHRCTMPNISDDGSLITFISDDPDLDTSLTIDTYTLFGLERSNPTAISCMAPNSDKSAALRVWSDALDFSADNNLIVFFSNTPFDASETTTYYDVFLYNRSTATTSRISNAVGGGPANHSSQSPGITPDGGTIYYTSQASDLTDDGFDQRSRIYSYDISTDTTTFLYYDNYEHWPPLDRAMSDDGTRFFWVDRSQDQAYLLDNGTVRTLESPITNTWTNKKAVISRDGSCYLAFGDHGHQALQLWQVLLPNL